jgi:hypothetical protein
MGKFNNYKAQFKLDSVMFSGEGKRERIGSQQQHKNFLLIPRN